MRNVALVALAGLGCTQDTEIQTFKRVLTTSQATFDAGMVAGDREPLQIFVQSTGRGDVTMFDVSVDDEDHWLVRDEIWKTHDTDADGIFDSQEIEGGSDSDPEYGLIEVVFAPEDEDEYRTTLTITSNDTEVTERTAEDMGIWKVVLRGIGRYPCASIYPDHHDFGPRPVGGYYSTVAYVQNCGVVTATVTSFDIEGDTSFYVDSPTPIYVLAGREEEIEIAWEPGSAGAEDAVVIPEINDPDFADSIELIGNNCYASVNTNWDDDGDGWFSCGGDCDDNDASINPSAQEKSSNGEDDDCDGSTDESRNALDSDDDGDGYSEDDGDCDDADENVYPGATERQNQVDDNCNGEVDDGTDWYDDDGDGYSERQGDCDDDAVLVYPGATESLNEVDDNCNGQVDEGTPSFDDDADGYHELSDPWDCNDNDPWTFPGAIEDCDERDNDCDNQVDEGADDSENGACAFLVEREVATSTKTCAAVHPAGGALALGLALLAGLSRRRDDDHHHADGTTAA